MERVSVLLTILCFCLQMAKPQPFAGATASNLNPCSNMKTASDELPPPRKRINWKEAVGLKFNLLKVVKFVSKNCNRQAVVEFLCDCGNSYIGLACNVKAGKVQSCGCLAKGVVATIGLKLHDPVDRMMQKMLRTYHGVLYRCHDEKYGHPRYRGRGITVCDRWRFGEGAESGFSLFVRDMGLPPSRKHSIERKNNDGNYEKSNCVWATCQEQSENRSNNIYLEYEGLNLTITQWAKKLGIQRGTLCHRHHHGWSVKEVLSIPVKKPFSEQEFWG